jgi:hypothetical protein
MSSLSMMMGFFSVRYFFVVQSEIFVFDRKDTLKIEYLFFWDISITL